MLILSEIKINKRKLELISKICKGWTVNLANKNNKNKGGVALIYRNSLKTFIKKIKIIDELNVKLALKRNLKLQDYMQLVRIRIKRIIGING